MVLILISASCALPQKGNLIQRINSGLKCTQHTSPRRHCSLLLTSKIQKSGKSRVFFYVEPWHLRSGCQNSFLAKQMSRLFRKNITYVQSAVLEQKVQCQSESTNR